MALVQEVRPPREADFAGTPAIGGEVGLPRLDVILGLAAGAVEFFLERLATATGEVGDNKAGIAALWSGLDAGDYALHAAP